MRVEQPRVTTPIATAGAADGWVTVRTQASGFRTEVRAGDHAFVADEPLAVGGTNSGPTPYDYLLGALGACTTMTLRMYAGRKGWPLEEVEVQLRNARSHAADCDECETKPVGFRRLERRIELRGPLTEEQRRRLLEIADRCPVKQTLGQGIAIEAVA
jgi:putative redox protein